MATSARHTRRRQLRKSLSNDPTRNVSRAFVGFVDSARIHPQGFPLLRPTAVGIDRRRCGNRVGVPVRRRTLVSALKQTDCRKK